jgi:RND family efflux transporter MFP subunit
MKAALKYVLPVLIVLVGAGALAVMYLNRPVAETRIPEVLPPLVRTVEAVPGDLQLTVYSQGTVTARTASSLVPEVPGRVIEMSPSLVPGGFFDEGDVLLTLDASDYEQNVIRTRLEVARAEVRLAQEQAEAEVARREWEDLHPGEEPPPLTSRELQLAEAVAAVEAAKAALDRQQADLGRTRIRAPYTGRVREKMVDLGQYVTPGQAVARIYSVDRAEVRLPLPDAELAYVDVPLVYRGYVDRTNRPKVILRADFAGAVHEWEGRIVRTEGEIDPKSRMVQVVAEVIDPYGRGENPDRPPLALGMFVDAEIVGHRVEDVIVLPRTALRGSDRVWVVDTDGRLHFREVDVLRTGRENIVIRSGLESGDQVCLSPLAAPTDGMKVRLLNDGEDS